VLLPQLRRVRWAVRATLVLGVAASVVANVLHALDNPISQTIAAWPPCALLLTVELISRVPVHRRSLAFARLLATAIIAGIAAWVSYWHMAGVAARYGETGASPYLLPLSVDGLIVVASICLVELGGRITAVEAEATETARSVRKAAQSAATVTLTSAARAKARVTATPIDVPVAASPAQAPAAAPREAGMTGLVPALGRLQAPAAVETTSQASRRRVTAAALAEAAAALEVPTLTPTATRQPRAATTGKTSAGRAHSGITARGAGPARNGASSSRTEKGTKARRSPAETVALAARIKAERPEITEAELATTLGISASRWRTVRREAAQSGDLRLAA